MPQRGLIGKPALAALAGLALTLGNVPRAQAGDNDPVGVHLCRALYELRDAKEDVRSLKGLDDDTRIKTLGAVDDAISLLKKCLADIGFQPGYIPPDFDDYRPGEETAHLGRVIRCMKQAKEDLRTAKNVPAEDRDATIAALDKAAERIQAVLLAASNPPPPRPADDRTTYIHLRIAVIELREVKGDVKSLKGLTEAQRDRTLAAIDDAIGPMTDCFVDLGMDREDGAYHLYPENDPSNRLRRAIRDMNEAKEELTAPKGATEQRRDGQTGQGFQGLQSVMEREAKHVTDEHRDAAIAAMANASERLQAVLNALK